MPRTAARISRSSSVGISSSRAMPPGRLPLSGVLAREVELGLHRPALIVPVQPLLQVGNRLRRAAAAVERLAEVEERVAVLQIGRVRGPQAYGALKQRYGAGVIASVHEGEPLLVELRSEGRVDSRGGFRHSTGLTAGGGRLGLGRLRWPLGLLLGLLVLPVLVLPVLVLLVLLRPLGRGRSGLRRILSSRRGVLCVSAAAHE